MSWYLTALKSYAVFTGRSRRREYWMFFLFNILIAFGLGIVEGALGLAPQSKESVLATIYQLAVLIPSIAVGVRRMHDTDHSGWWLLLPIVNLVLLATEGQKGQNRFGADPKATAPGAVAAPFQAPSQGGAQAEGYDLAAFCMRCGTKFMEGATYCPRCGTPRAA